MHFLLPLAFAVSPTLGLEIGWPWLTLLLSVFLLPLLEWIAQKNPSSVRSTSQWGSWFPRAVMLGVIVQCLGLVFIAQEQSWLKATLLPLRFRSCVVCILLCALHSLVRITFIAAV